MVFSIFVPTYILTFLEEHPLGGTNIRLQFDFLDHSAIEGPFVCKAV